MSKATKTREGTLKASLLSIGVLLLGAGAEALASGNLTTGGLVLAAGLAFVGGHEVVSQREFAFEDEFAQLVKDNEAVAREVESFIRENADTLDADVEDVLDQRRDSGE